jgi:hypothetical protein
MKNQILSLTIIVFLLFASIFSFAQGCIINEESYDILREIPQSIKTRGVSPIAYSLEQFTPSTLDQRQTSMCASFALSTISTILYAKNVLKTSNLDEINRNRFSPSFLYYLFRDKNDMACEGGVYGYDAAKYISLFGLPFMNDVEDSLFHPYTNNMICNYYPNNESDLIADIVSGSKYRFMKENGMSRCGDYFEGLFYVDQSLLKSDLSQGRPCYLSIKMSDSTEYFPNFTNDGTIKFSKSGDGHALVIIGYNDTIKGGAFQVLNSWGESWGQDGKSWIKYEDLNTIDGYILSFEASLEEPLSYNEGAFVIEDDVRGLLNQSREILYFDDYKKYEKVPSPCECDPSDYNDYSYLMDIDLFCSCYIRICSLVYSSLKINPSADELVERCLSEQLGQSTKTFKCVGKTKSGNRCKSKTRCSNLRCHNHGGDCY